MLDCDWSSDVCSSDLMEMLSSGSEDERVNAGAVIAVVGATQVSQFVKLVLESDKLEVRQAAARAVAAIGGEAPNELVATIRAQADPEKAMRVVGVLDLLGLPRLVAPIQAALAHPDPAVKNAAFEMLERAADPVAEDVLRFLIRGEDEEVAVRGLEIAAKRRHAALATDIARLAQTTERETLGAGCCAFFQAVPTPAGVPALQRIFDMRGKMMGLVKGWSEKTRAAAVSAAVLVNTPAAKSIVKAALKDQSALVREAAGAEAKAK
jgi:HEAT repeat protein